MARPTPSSSALKRTGSLSAAGVLSRVDWLKASASESGSCVEITVLGHRVCIQDSKVADGGPVLMLGLGAWSTLRSKIQAGEFDL